jgi:hypothetical protein
MLQTETMQSESQEKLEGDWTPLSKEVGKPVPETCIETRLRWPSKTVQLSLCRYVLTKPGKPLANFYISDARNE